MAVPRLREMLPGLSVIASEKAARTLASEKAVAFFSQIDDQLTASMLEKGTINNRHRPAPLGQLRIAIDRVVRREIRSASAASLFRFWKRPATASAA